MHKLDISRRKGSNYIPWKPTDGINDGAAYTILEHYYARQNRK